MKHIVDITYGEISHKIKALEYQTAILNQIFSNKKYLSLIKEFKEEGIVIISDTKRNDKIIANLIK